MPHLAARLPVNPIWPNSAASTQMDSNFKPASRLSQDPGGYQPDIMQSRSVMQTTPDSSNTSAVLGSFLLEDHRLTQSAPHRQQSETRNNRTFCTGAALCQNALLARPFRPTRTSGMRAQRTHYKMLSLSSAFLYRLLVLSSFSSIGRFYNFTFFAPTYFLSR